MLRILIKFKDSVLRVVETDKDEVTIGRNLKNDIQIDNLAVSSFHARVSRQLGHYFIEDLDSTNGTFVADKRVTKWGLSDNDAVTVGKHTLVFLIEENRDDAGGKIDLEELDMDRTVVLDSGRSQSLQQKAAGGDDESIGGALGTLTVLKGKADESRYELTSKLSLIGRDDSAAVRIGGLLTPKVAGFISRDKRGYSLIPPETQNKLKLNGNTVRDATYLTNGDVIEFASARMRFSLVSEGR
ncbi:MAG: FHA domain-containing protein [Desulfuromonadales bacterium]|nr:FHA domain-containing protein [Desulfuromonadales bacterium]NIR33590.1 FHA domain-containing protein [Desulfuromonadales bacterium]NIS39822.1 FHA domain-containing protein [Desulfuromonadales bacterium]